ncbi:MAG: AMP-dependent synthetase/ligase [Candidatus Nanopelagicales bacterium]
MREVSTPSVIELPITGNLAGLARTNATNYPDWIAYSEDTPAGSVDFTAKQFYETVRACAKGLLARGIERGDRLGVMAANSYAWSVLDFSAWAIGAGCVPIYDTSSVEQIDWIVQDSGAKVGVAGTPELLARLQAAVPQGMPLWLLNSDLVRDLTSEGAAISDDALEAAMGAVGPDDIATIVYTSGTTGRPRGCVLTHSNFLFEAYQVGHVMAPLMSAADASTVLFLPLAHIFGRFGYVMCMHVRTRIIHCPDARQLGAMMIAHQPTFVVAVPRVFEKIYNGASQKAHESGRGRIFDRASHVAAAYGKAKFGDGPSLMLRIRHAFYDRLVYSKIRAAMGGKARTAISGGAALGDRLTYFFAGIGMLVIEGYGLTETTGVIVFNKPDRPKLGSVGVPAPGCAVRIGEDGEIWLRGGNVMTGYFKNPAATAEAIDAEGWFHTGDLGSLDAEGCLRVTGRKKEIIVTAGGKNVAPIVLEDRVQANRLVSHCIVVGEGRPFVGALLTLDPDALEFWARNLKKPLPDLADISDPELIAELQSAVDYANEAVSKAESIRAWRVLDTELSERTGHITSTQKLRRAIITQDFADEIEALYSRPKPSRS